MKVINTDKAPQAIGPYSQAIEVNGFVFCSGQIGLIPESGNLVDGLENQTKQIISNIKNILEASGSSLEKVVKTTVFITNINDFPKVNEIYGNFFTEHKPARSTVEVSHLPKGALIEIEVIALK